MSLERCMSLPTDLKPRVLALAAAQPTPVRSDRRLPAAGLLALAISAMVAILAAAGGPAHADGRPAAVGSWVVGGMVALAAGATWSVLPARRSMLGRPRGQLLAVIVGVPLFVGLWLVVWHTSYVDPFQRVGFRCFSFTAATAPWPFALLAYLSRRIEPRHPALLGAALGAASGAWGAVMVELWCPLADPGHVATGHVLPVVLLILAAAYLGSRLFTVRRVELCRI
jgi:hypothetical protein